jgi:hypothetical protein
MKVIERMPYQRLGTFVIGTFMGTLSILADTIELEEESELDSLLDAPKEIVELLLPEFGTPVVKRTLRGSMLVKYKVLPKKTERLLGVLTEGMAYGRIRNNTFYWDWKHETWDKQHKLGRLDNRSMGVGGSLIFKSAIYHGVSFTAGYYGTLVPSFWRMEEEEIGTLKAGKDTLSRYTVTEEQKYHMGVVGEAFLEYQHSRLNLKVGRQMFESVFTKSNDTKMIPNTFDGISTVVKFPFQTEARLAYFTKQKLRDHTSSHDVLTFQDATSEPWRNNDDSAIHKGLSYERFQVAGQESQHQLVIADVRTKVIDNLNAIFSFLSVPNVVYDLVAEVHYKMMLAQGWALRPGVRYFYQKDDGGGEVAGYTNLSGQKAIGYTKGVANSLDSSLFNTRCDLLMPNKKGFFRVGYSEVEDKADIIAPWRGFPTSGFTRAMSQYNWYANTKTYMARFAYKFNSSFNMSLRYALQDFDDDKPYVQADSDVFQLDAVYKLTPNFYVKSRVGLVNADVGARGKEDLSYNEYRLELNYLF